MKCSYIISASHESHSTQNKLSCVLSIVDQVSQITHMFKLLNAFKFQLNLSQNKRVTKIALDSSLWNRLRIHLKSSIYTLGWVFYKVNSTKFAIFFCMGSQGVLLFTLFFFRCSFKVNRCNWCLWLWNFCIGWSVTSTKSV